MIGFRIVTRICGKIVPLSLINSLFLDVGDGCEVIVISKN